MIKITHNILLDEGKIKFSYLRSPGPGGQNVNKVETAVLLRFNIKDAEFLPEEIRLRLLAIIGNKLTRRGELVIKATRFRTQDRNKKDALERLIKLIKSAAILPKNRKKTKPTKASVQARLDKKKIHSKKKSLRRYVSNI